MRIPKNQRPSFSKADNTLQLSAPRSWKELSQEQLRYVLRLLWTESEPVAVKTLMFFRLTGLQVVGHLRHGVRCCVRHGAEVSTVNIMSWQVQQLMHQFDYIDTPDGMDVRLESVRGCKAVDVVFHGMSFGDWLQCEKYYQAFLHSKDQRMIDKLGQLLYRKEDGEAADPWTLDEAERACCFFWVSHVKKIFASQFTHFFKPASGSSGVGFVQSMNAQIRALTGGDITQEDRVLQCDCWRALTELNEKAREAEEFEKKYGK